MEEKSKFRDVAQGAARWIARCSSNYLIPWVKRIADLFFFRMAYSAVIVMLLVWALFQIKPASGFVHLVMNKPTGPTVFEAARAEIVLRPVENQNASVLERFGANAVHIDTYGPCKLALGLSHYLDGRQMSGGDYLELTPKESARRVVTEGGQIVNTAGFYLFPGSEDAVVTSFSVEEAEITLSSIDHDAFLNRDITTTSENAFVLCRGTLVINVDTDMSVELVHGDGSRENLTQSSDPPQVRFYLSGGHPFSAQRTEGETDPFYMVESNDNDSIGSDSHENSSEPWSIDARVLGVGDYNALHLSCSSIAGLDIDAKWCHGVKTRGDGKLSISYTPSPQEYNLQDQQVQLGKLTSGEAYYGEDENGLSVDLSYCADDESLVVVGHVSQASLSGMDLFPDFRNWYFSNVYLAPFTVVSVALSTFGQMLARDKQRAGT